MSMKKAPCHDGVLTEKLVAAGEYGLEELTRLTNMVYIHGYFTEEVNKSIIITLLNINGTTKCEKHRTISLMSHITKLIIRGRTSQEIAPEQYGFMHDKRIRIAIFVLRRMSKRAIEKKTDIYACFIDYNKAFDTVRHTPLIDLPKALDVDSHDVQLLAVLYWKQKAEVRHNGEISEWMRIKQGVRQGCVSSLHLFTMYTEVIMISLEDK